MSVKPFLAICLTAALLTLCACGKKGDLVLPSPPPAAPASPAP